MCKVNSAVKAHRKDRDSVTEYSIHFYAPFYGQRIGNILHVENVKLRPAKVSIEIYNVDLAIAQTHFHVGLSISDANVC